MSNLGQYTNNSNKNTPWGGGGGRTQNSAVGMVNPVPSPMQQQQQQQQQMVLNQNALNNLNTSGMVHQFQQQQQQQQQQQAFQNVIGLQQHHQHQQNLAANLGPLQQMANSAISAAAGLGTQLTSTQLFQQVGAVTYPNTRGLNPTAFGTTAGPITGVPPVVMQTQNQQNSLNSSLNSLNTLNTNLTGQSSVVGMATNSVNKQRVFTGMVTKLHDNFGFVDEDVFFQSSACVKGSHPMLGDRVLVEASYNPNMPFKWNATRIQVLPNTSGSGGGGGNNNMSMNSGGGHQSRSHGHHGNQKNYNNNNNNSSNSGSNAYNAVPPPNDQNMHQHSNYNNNSRNNQRSRGGNLGNRNNNNRDRDRSPLNFMTVNNNNNRDRDRDRDLNSSSKGRDTSEEDSDRKRRREERMREREKENSGSSVKSNKSPVRTRLRSRSRSPKSSRNSVGTKSGSTGGGGGGVSLGGSGRRSSRAVPRYMVQIPKIALNLPEADVLELRRRYSNLYIPSDFFHTNFRWVDAFPPEKPFALQNRPCTFHIMNKDVENPNAKENDAILEPPDADYLFSAKVMLMSMCGLDELYQKCCGVAAPSADDKDQHGNKDNKDGSHGNRDKDSRHHGSSKRSSSSSNNRERDRDRDRDSSEERPTSDFVHPARLINFLVGLRGKNETMAIGGPWSPSLDGADPKNDPSVLIRTAIRTCKALTGIDLSNCTKWYRFVELYYRRRSSSSSSSKGKDTRARVETVVVYLPDIWTSSCVPTRLEWDAMQLQYQRALEERLLSNVNVKSRSAAKVSTATEDGGGGGSCQQATDVKMSTSDGGVAATSTSSSPPQQQQDAEAEAASDAEMPQAAGPQIDDEKDEDPTSDVATPGNISALSSAQHKPEPTHYSQLDPKIMSFTALREELNARNLSSKGLLKSQLIARLARALKNEESEEVASVDGDEEEEDEDIEAEKVAQNDSGSAKAPSVGASSKEKKSEAEDTTTSSSSSNKKKSKMDDKERAILEKRYTLPDQPQIIVHPSKVAKSGKFDCTLMSLSLLLDYRPEDTKEHSFEVSLFAELFNEMFMRDFGFNIYRALYELPDEKTTEKEEKSSSKKGDKEDTSGGSKKKDEDEKSGEQKKKSDDSSSTSNDKKKDEKDDGDDTNTKDKTSPKKEDEKQSSAETTTTDDEKKDLEKKSCDSEKKSHDSGKKSDDEDDDDDDEDHEINEENSVENGTKTSNNNNNNNKEKQQSERDKDRDSVHSSSTISSARDRRNSSSKIHEKNSQERNEKKSCHGQHKEQKIKMYTKDKHLLLSFIYFDQTRCGYIFDKDIEDLLYTLGLSLSRAQVKKLVGKVITRDSLHYRKLTDAPKDDDDSSNTSDSATAAEQQDDGKTEKDNNSVSATKTEWALGNKRLLPVFDREDTFVAKKRKLNSDAKEESAKDDSGTKKEDGPGGEDGLIMYRGALVDIGKLMSQLERSEKARLETESRMVNLKHDNSKLSEKCQKSSSTIKHLTSDVKDFKEKLRNVEETLAKTQIQSKIYHNVLSDIRDKVEPVLKSSALSTAAPKSSEKDEHQQAPKKEKDRDSTGTANEREKERDSKKMAEENNSKSRWEKESTTSSAKDKDSSSVKEEKMDVEPVAVVKTESQ